MFFEGFLISVGFIFIVIMVLCVNFLFGKLSCIIILSKLEIDIFDVNDKFIGLYLY